MRQHILYSVHRHAEINGLLAVGVDLDGVDGIRLDDSLPPIGLGKISIETKQLQRSALFYVVEDVADASRVDIVTVYE